MAKDHFENFSGPSQPQSRHAHKFDLMHSVVPAVAIKNHGELVASLAEVNDMAIAAACGTILASLIEKCFLDSVGQQNKFVDTTGHTNLRSDV
jgi:hypothetical protein